MSMSRIFSIRRQECDETIRVPFTEPYNHYLNAKLHSINDQPAYVITDGHITPLKSWWSMGMLSRHPHEGAALYMDNNGEIAVIFAINGTILEHSYYKPRDSDDKIRITPGNTNIKSLKDLNNAIREMRSFF